MLVLQRSINIRQGRGGFVKEPSWTRMLVVRLESAPDSGTDTGRLRPNLTRAARPPGLGMKHGPIRLGVAAGALRSLDSDGSRRSDLACRGSVSLRLVTQTRPGLLHVTVSPAVTSR